MRLFTIEATDGFPLTIREFAPSGPPRAVLLLAPAIGVKQSFYAPCAEWLAQQGILVWTFDYRGMGASRPESLRGFSASIVDWARKDCAAILDQVAWHNPRLPIFWLGHSVGAQLFGLLPNQERVSAMLSVAAGSGYWQYNAAPLRYYVLSLWMLIMPIALRFNGYFPGRRLGAVGDLPYGVAEQWRRWCLQRDYLGAEEELKRDLEKVKVPITALSIQDDEMMTFRGTRALFELYSSAPVTYSRLRPSELGVKKIGHFGFFRPAMKEALWPMIPSWMERGSPS